MGASLQEMNFEYDKQTRTYSLRMTIGEKLIPANNLKAALSRAILGTTAQLVRREIIPRQHRELTDLLFWFEEGQR